MKLRTILSRWIWPGLLAGALAAGWLWLNANIETPSPWTSALFGGALILITASQTEPLTTRLRRAGILIFPGFIRRGRVQAWMRKIFNIALAACVVIFGWAMLQNVLAPPIAWQPTANGPTVPEFVQTLVIDTLSKKLYAGTLGGGVFVSSDEGKQWQGTSAGLTNLWVESLAVDPRNGTLYAGTWDGVFVFQKQEASWQPLSTGLEEDTEVEALIVDPNDGTLYAAMNDAVYTSRDGGANWQPPRTRLKKHIETLVMSPNTGTLYAGTDDGVFISLDGGKNWQASSTGITNLKIRTLMIVDSDPRDETLYAGTDNGVFVSHDEGASWQTIGPELAGMHVQALALNSDDGSLYAGIGDRDGKASNGVFISRDSGMSWQALGTGLTSRKVQRLVFGPDRKTLYAGTDCGVFISLSGDSRWQPTSVGLANTWIRALSIDSHDGALYAGTDGGVFVLKDSEDLDGRWQGAGFGITNPLVQVLIVHPRNGTLYVGTYQGGVFSSHDGGTSWHAVGSGLANRWVQALGIDLRNGTLYAGTDRGVFALRSGETDWQATAPELEDTNIRALVIAPEDGTLYAGTDRGVLISQDGGAGWQIPGSELPGMRLQALVVGPREGTFYIGTDRGVFVSRDGGAVWQNAGTELAGMSVKALVIDPDDKSLYAGTDHGVFVSRNGGTDWKPLNTGLTNTHIQSLVINPHNGRLYVGTGSGVFVFQTPGYWRSIGLGIPNTEVRALLVDPQKGTLYAGIGNSFSLWSSSRIFASEDRGVSWQSVNVGLPGRYVRALVIDPQGRLYVEIRGMGIFVSGDQGASWQNTLLKGRNIRLWAIDTGNGTLYAKSDGEMFFLASDAISWQNAGEHWEEAGPKKNRGRLQMIAPYLGPYNAGINDGGFIGRDGGSTGRETGVGFAAYDWKDLFSTGHRTVLMARDGDTLFYEPGSGYWMPASNDGITRSIAFHSLSEGETEVWTAWGAGIYNAELPENLHPLSSSAWLFLRVLAWRTPDWLFAHGGWVTLALALIMATFLTQNYINLARPFGLSMRTVLWARNRLDEYARPEKLAAYWPAWEKLIRGELLYHGEVIPDDLTAIPAPFRHYALRRYAQTYESFQALDLRPYRLCLLARDRLRRWRTAWTAAGRALGRQPGLAPEGRPAVIQLMNLLAETLGLTLETGRDFGSVYAVKVEAPALRLNVPLRFPLVCVADPQPAARTVEALVDAIDVIRESGYFALVVPLETPFREPEAASALRRAVTNSPHVHDFVILNLEDVLEILSARQPLQALAKRILAQVDLAMISPFVINGPTPDTMFFGREAEVKALVEGAPSTDFAIVGNRKIGKTSLLKRAKARLATTPRIHPLLLDCQTVRDAAGFYTVFETQAGITLPEATPEGFAAAIHTLRRAGPLPVLLLDEIDALLSAERTSGESLAKTWRALAQAGECHFIFCGATGLARSLDDPHSVFFNFPQPLPLQYLTPETARMVLTQPLETLGVTLEETDRLLEEVVALTSGHPNLLQYVGRGLVAAANRRQERLIRRNDLAELHAATDFTDYFLKTVWGEAGPLERLITLILPPEGGTVADLETALAARNIQPPEEKLDAALKMLRIYAVLEQHERRYTFIPHAFPEILHRTQDVERLIRQEQRNWETRS